jgi:hypothetical protein
MLGQAQLAVHQGQQDVPRILVTAFPFQQQPCDLIWRHFGHMQASLGVAPSILNEDGILAL